MQVAVNQREVEHVSLRVLTETCSTVVEAIGLINEEFAQIIEEVIPSVTPEDTYAMLVNTEASITVLVVVVRLKR